MYKVTLKLWKVLFHNKIIFQVCVGSQIQSLPDSIQQAVFVGFHTKNQLLFALAPVAKVEEEKVFYSNTDFALTQKDDQIQLVLTKVIGIRSQLKVRDVIVHNLRENCFNLL